MNGLCDRIFFLCTVFSFLMMFYISIVRWDSEVHSYVVDSLKYSVIIYLKYVLSM